MDRSQRGNSGGTHPYKTCQGSVDITVATSTITNGKVLRVLKPDRKSYGKGALLIGRASSPRGGRYLSPQDGPGPKAMTSK